jgi:hypothetical protein
VTSPSKPLLDLTVHLFRVPTKHDSIQDKACDHPRLRWVPAFVSSHHSRSMCDGIGDAATVSTVHFGANAGLAAAANTTAKSFPDTSVRVVRLFPRLIAVFVVHFTGTKYMILIHSIARDYDRPWSLGVPALGILVLHGRAWLLPWRHICAPLPCSRYSHTDPHRAVHHLTYSSSPAKFGNEARCYNRGAQPCPGCRR